MKFFWQSLLLFLSFAFVFIWEQTVLADYTIQALGFFIFLFLLISARKKHFDLNKLLGEDGSWSIFLLNTIILLLIFSTGLFNSTLFFLLYFLGFGIAFVFEPAIVFVFVIGVILIFIQDALKNDVARNLILLVSLVLISPLAYFFGRSYRVAEKQEGEIESMKDRSQDAATTIADDVEDLLEQEKRNLKEEDVEKLNDILEETETLREEKKVKN